ncbi:L,D-transpeptidase family protein [Pararhizobium sp.]|uniref:L,D-transpeptidase family protein n=1 Tax=Pararhizobium sp. TaxID=1977563 RepID=UPI00271FA681|nr:L,D-transpeptidase family protein [Pararhizobium sp.]MDO9418955.1 L,D-transpeptidase family protein [Pararhizobium sp.]
MRLFKTAAVTALVLSCAFSTVGAGPAEATTLMDMFFKKKRPVEQEFNAADPNQSLNGQPLETKKVPKAVARVSGPTYFTYKAEALKQVSLAKIADPLTTGALTQHGLPPIHQSVLNGARQALAAVNVRAVPDVAAAVQSYYGEHGDFVWIDQNGVTAKAKAAIALLADAAKIGLDPEDYAVAVPPEQFDAGDLISRQKELVTFEARLSVAALSYIADTVRGRIDPNKISGYHDFKRKTLDLATTLTILGKAPDAAGYMRSRSPSSSQFLALQTELETLKATTDGVPKITIADGTLLKPGAKSTELANIIAAIRQKGSDALKVEHSVTLAGYTGGEDYTPELVALVEGFQKEHGLKPDGVVGKASIRILTGGDTVSSKINKVVVAMEQARWLPNDLGARHVFINQPAFMVYYHEQNAEKFAMRVVVGSKSNQTYFFQDQIETVEFNPYWGVPQSIIINEMLPKLRNDPSYLDRMGYEVEVGGQTVSSSNVDWSNPKAVAVRQPPSSDNALGDLKILFPNSHAIYMHDTPSKSFFARDQRALSHGCVRLSDPRLMAAAVLGTTVDDVAKQIADGRNKGVKVTAKIPVYVAYFTAWPNKDGKVEYFDDVYDRDMYMNRAFDATKAARRAAS